VGASGSRSAAEPEPAEVPVEPAGAPDPEAEPTRADLRDPAAEATFAAALDDDETIPLEPVGERLPAP
jgi:hypothetical protein